MDPKHAKHSKGELVDGFGQTMVWTFVTLCLNASNAVFKKIMESFITNTFWQEFYKKTGIKQVLVKPLL